MTSKRPTSPAFPLCCFAFADGRHCTLPAAPESDGICYHHAHTPQLLSRKPSSAKSRVSISSKLIENKGLQLQHFGHLQKIGGRGSYQLVYATHHAVRKSPPLTPAFPPLARPTLNLRIFNIFPTTGGRVPLVRPRLTPRLFVGDGLAHPAFRLCSGRLLRRAGLGTDHRKRATLHWPPVAGRRPLLPPHCALARKVPKSPHCWLAAQGRPSLRSGQGNIHPLPGV